MASEKGAVELMDKLDKAIEEITNIDGRLGLYEKKLSVRPIEVFLDKESDTRKFSLNRLWPARWKSWVEKIPWSKSKQRTFKD